MSEFNPKSPSPGIYTGVSNEDYHSAKGISNSGLLLVQRNPADYIWAQNAPSDFGKSKAIDTGTAIHCALLEPERFEQDVAIAPVKGRETKKFTEFAIENSDKICLVESEYDTVRLTVDSARAHPSFNSFLNLDGDCEVSIFTQDKERDILCKIRPDKDLTKSGRKVLVDAKTTRDISDWRSSLHWKNPLFTYNYGHNAAYYLDIASQHYGEQYDEYLFLLIQSTIELGRYPVAPILITREELQYLGFFDQVADNLDRYAECYHSNDWNDVERFPRIDPPFDGVEEITIEDA